MERKHRILLVEDEPKLCKIIQDELQQQGYLADIAMDGLSAEKMFASYVYDLILLDINLPHKNGLTLCKAFREQNNHIPIIILTALGEIQDKVDAFALGADDYVVKPFHFDELFARLKVFLKRSEKQNDEPTSLTVDDLHIDFRNKTVWRNQVEIPLTAKEFALLVLLCQNRGKVISKQEILEKVWDLSFDTGTNTIEVYISFIRNKIDKPFENKLIHTKPGFGYYIK